MKNIMDFISKLSPKQAKEKVVRDQLAKLPNECNVNQRIINMIETERQVEYFQTGILKDPYMRRTIFTAKKCERCERSFKDHPELRKEMNHKEYYGRCLRKGGPDCKSCREQNPKWFKICRRDMSCLCNECHDETVEIQDMLWNKKGE